MRLLLDTHAFIWLDANRNRLSEAAENAITNSDNEVFLSYASIWEIQIKIQLDKLKLAISLEETITAQQESNGIQLLSIQLNHILALNNLPHHHRDPFDRLLIAQAQVENLTLVTHDTKIGLYDVATLW
jgi:PIN domain nuclease of toxin-antitoxin system